MEDEILNLKREGVDNLPASFHLRRLQKSTPERSNAHHDKSLIDAQHHITKQIENLEVDED